MAKEREKIGHPKTNAKGRPVKHKGRITDPDAIIARVVGRFVHDDEAEQHRTLRAVVVLDPKNVSFLESAIEEANFLVVVPPRRSLREFEDKGRYLAGRILVTAKTAPQTIDDAPVFQYGIIGLDALGRVDRAARLEENATARLISRVIAEYRLPAERSAWLLMLHSDGKHVFRRLD